MRKIELNPDDTLNILDTRKVYVLRVNWGTPGLGTKYYIPVKSRRCWRFEREGNNRFASYEEKDLQYAIQRCLLFCKRDYPEDAIIMEFKDLAEFEIWKTSQ
jgi:hypothetical protein